MVHFDELRLLKAGSILNTAHLDELLSTGVPLFRRVTLFQVLLKVKLHHILHTYTEKVPVLFVINPSIGTHKFVHYVPLQCTSTTARGTSSTTHRRDGSCKRCWGLGQSSATHRRDGSSRRCWAIIQQLTAELAAVDAAGLQFNNSPQRWQ